MIAAPKKIGSMKQMMKYFGLTAMAVMGLLACTRAQVEQPVQKTITLTTTINLGGEEDDDSKALSALGVKTFANGDKIAVLYECTTANRVHIVESDDVSSISVDGKTARFSVTFPGGENQPKPDGKIRIVYPPIMAKDITYGSNISLDDDDSTLSLRTLNEDLPQGGTLSFVSSRDLCTFDGYFVSVNNQPTFPSSITLTNRLAMCEFKVFRGEDNITSSITKMTLVNGSNTYTIERTASTDPIYVAMLPVENGIFDIIVNESYYKQVSGKTLAAGKMYPINLRLPGAAVNLATLSNYYTAQSGDVLTGTPGKDIRIIIADGATVTLQNVSINADNTVYPGIRCNGDATLLLVGSNTVNGRHEDYPGIYPGPTGKTLVIRGNGSLSASSAAAPGIGSSNYSDDTFKDCGNILIEGGTIVAHGGDVAPGIGSGKGLNNGVSSISSSCGDITIKMSVEEVTAYKGTNASPAYYSIGPGPNGSTCGTVTTGNSYKGYFTDSPIVIH